MKTWILLTLAVLIILWGNPASSQSTIHIWGTADTLMVRNQVAQYLDYLDVNENVYVSVGFTRNLPEKLAGMTFCLNPSAPNTYLIIKVRIDARLKKPQQKLVLAHEMIHVKQYATKELIAISNEQVMWKGRKYRYQPAAPRQENPWEKVAYKNDQWLAKQYKRQMEAPLVAGVKKP